MAGNQRGENQEMMDLDRYRHLQNETNFFFESVGVEVQCEMNPASSPTTKESQPWKYVFAHYRATYHCVKFGMHHSLVSLVCLLPFSPKPHQNHDVHTCMHSSIKLEPFLAVSLSPHRRAVEEEVQSNKPDECSIRSLLHGGCFHRSTRCFFPCCLH